VSFTIQGLAEFTGGTAGRLKRSANGIGLLVDAIEIKLGRNNERVMNFNNLLPTNTIAKYNRASAYYTSVDEIIGYTSTAAILDSTLSFLDQDILAGDFAKIVITLTFHNDQRYVMTDTGATPSTVSFSLTDPELQVPVYSAPSVAASVPSVYYFKSYVTHMDTISSGSVSFSQSIPVNAKLYQAWSFIFTTADLTAVDAATNHNSVWNTQAGDVFNRLTISHGDKSHVIEGPEEAKLFLLEYQHNHLTLADSLVGNFDVANDSFTVSFSPGINTNHQSDTYIGNLNYDWTFSGSGLSANSTIYTVLILEDQIPVKRNNQ